MRAQRASKPLPDRVLLYGVTGSGKSTAALAVGARTGHPVALVGELTWLPGWVPVDGVVQRELIGEVVAGERWLLDSAYGAWLDLVLPRAEWRRGSRRSSQTSRDPRPSHSGESRRDMSSTMFPTVGLPPVGAGPHLRQVRTVTGGPCSA
ncbi:hypothetical protein [Nocardioides sp. zg-1230]|uniref:hypothetical protein n=1 Tax=Nocardioides sp. zg-1230 TaxID=2736601 RepID=UPI00155364F6|nr:hypothetical protein [Nocardioides sp. zg-1230]NPC42749.1 hypothetical protein [Nocardioides sp. zg-1230]